MRMENEAIRVQSRDGAFITEYLLWLWLFAFTVFSSLDCSGLQLLDRPDLAALCIIGSVFSFIVAYILLFPSPYFKLTLDR
jgi:hypothetical protein